MNKLFAVQKKCFKVSHVMRFQMICLQKTGGRKTNRNFLLLFIAFAFLFPLLFCTYGFGSETVSYSSITTLKRLSQSNKYYTIDDTVRIDAPYYRFLVKSSHGDYDVLSIKDLLKVCHEICIIEEYRKTDQGSQAWKGASESLKDIGRGAKQIVKEPKESAKAFARAGGKLVRGVGRFIKKKFDKEEKDASGDTDRAKGGEGFVVGKHAREFAAEVGLDVYSDNPYVQALIQEVAKARSKGSIGTSVGLFFLSPIQGLGLLSNSLTPNGFDAETEKLIRDESPAELRYVLTKKYEKELGIAPGKESIVEDLLDNPNYSPREQAYLYLYLKRLGKPDTGTAVEGVSDTIKYLSKVQTPNAATHAINQMELFSAYQTHAKDLTRLTAASDKIGAITEKKELFFIIPYDIVESTPEMKKFLDEVVKFAKTQGTKGTQLWFTGDVTRGFTSESKAKGVIVQEDVLQFSHFAPKEVTAQNK
jgi:hypothetical protein